jgi:hypothetical protein
MTDKCSELGSAAMAAHGADFSGAQNTFQSGGGFLCELPHNCSSELSPSALSVVKLTRQPLSYNCCFLAIIARYRDRSVKPIDRHRGDLLDCATKHVRTRKASRRERDARIYRCGTEDKCRDNFIAARRPGSPPPPIRYTGDPAFRPGGRGRKQGPPGGVEVFLPDPRRTASVWSSVISMMTDECPPSPLRSCHFLARMTGCRAF